MVTSTIEHEALKGLGQGTHERRAHPTTLARMPSQCETTGQDLHGVGGVAGKAKQPVVWDRRAWLLGLPQ